MKKILLTAIVLFSSIAFSYAQLLPSFQFGLKGGMNLTDFSHSGTFNTSNQAGYLAGIWMRFGALGFNFQPEAYVTGKDVNIDNNGSLTRARFTSLDVPLLFGAKIGAFGVGGRFYTGPVVSFALNKDQSFTQAAGDIVHLNYNDQNYAWQFGTGLDIKKISIDLRYEAGLSKVNYEAGSTHINLFNLSLAYKIF